MTTATEIKITRATLKRLDSMRRRQLKALHLYLTGYSVFGLIGDIREKVHDAVLDYLGIDE